MNTKPDWYTPADATAWDRVKDALQRDWAQTKRDMHVGGHELNQKLGDTVAQVRGAEAIPRADQPNPPKVVDRWEDAEVAIDFGYACRTHYGDKYPVWNRELEARLEHDWKGERSWEKVKSYVRHGYEVPR
jgi:hypothetical protein